MALVHTIVPSDQAGRIGARQRVLRPADVGPDGAVTPALLDPEWACTPQVELSFGTEGAIGPVAPFAAPSGPPGLQVTFSYRAEGHDRYNGMVEVHLVWRGLPEEPCAVVLAAQEINQRPDISRQVRRDELGPGKLDARWRLRSQREARWDDHLFVVVAEGTPVDARLLDRDGAVTRLDGPYCFFTGRELRPAPGFAQRFEALCAAHPERRPLQPPAPPMAEAARLLARHPGLAGWIRRSPAAAVLNSEAAVAGLARLPTGLAYAVVSSLAEAALGPHNLMQKAPAAAAWPASTMLVAGAVTPDAGLRTRLHTSLDAGLDAEGLSADDRCWLRGRPAAQELCRFSAERGLGAARALSLARIIDRPPSSDKLPALLDALDEVVEGVWLEQDVLPDASLGGHRVADLLAERRAALVGPVTAEGLQTLAHKLRSALGDLAVHLGRLPRSRPQTEPYLTAFGEAARLLADGRRREGLALLKEIAEQPSPRVPAWVTAAELVGSLRGTMEAGFPPVALADDRTLDSLARGFADYVIAMVEVAAGLDAELALLSGERSRPGMPSDPLGRLRSLSHAIKSHLAALGSRAPVQGAYTRSVAAAIAPEVAKYEQELDQAAHRLRAEPAVCTSLQDQDATVAAIVPDIDEIRAALKWLRANRRRVAEGRLAGQLEGRWDAVMARLRSLPKHAAGLFDADLRRRLEQSRTIGSGEGQLAERVEDIDAAEGQLALLEQLAEVVSGLAEPDRARLFPGAAGGSLAELEARVRQLYQARMGEHVRARQEERRCELVLSILTRSPPPPCDDVSTGRPGDWIDQLRHLAGGAAPASKVDLCRRQIRVALGRMVRQWLPLARIDDSGVEPLAGKLETVTEAEAGAFVANGDRLAAALERLAAAVGKRTSTFLELPELVWLLGPRAAADHPMPMIGLLPGPPLDPSTVLADVRLTDALHRQVERGFTALLQDLLPATLADVPLNEVRNRLGATLFRRLERARPALLGIEGVALPNGALQNWTMAADVLRYCLAGARAADTPARVRNALAKVLAEHDLVPPWLVLDAGA